jgi:hypothetical protein
LKSLHCQKSYVMEFIPIELCEAQNTSLLCFTFNGLKRLCYHLDSKRSMLRIHQDFKISWNFCIVTRGHIIRQLFPSPCEQMFCFHSGLYEKHIAPLYEGCIDFDIMWSPQGRTLPKWGLFSTLTLHTLIFVLSLPLGFTIWDSQLLINLKMRIYDMYCIIYNYLTIVFSFSCLWVGWVWVSIKTLLLHSMKSPKGAAFCVCVCFHKIAASMNCVWKWWEKHPKWWWRFFLLFPISLLIEN